jgi:hypothetical protein
MHAFERIDNGHWTMIILREGEGDGGGLLSGDTESQSNGGMRRAEMKARENLLEEYHLERPELHKVHIQRRAAQENACRETEERGEGRRGKR